MSLYCEFEQEGRNILDYWLKYGFKKGLPLFNAFVDKNNEPAPDGASFLITSRALWAFSLGYEVYGDKKYLDAADRAFEGYKYFYDEKLGGYFRDYGAVKVSHAFKKMYDHAFAIYGLAKYYFVSKNKKALERAFEIFDTLEERACDEVFGGYYDFFDEEWKYFPNKRHPDGTVKNMNCMLHILEAYTLFYDVTKNERVFDALKKLTRITIDKIFNKETNHLNMYFDRQLNSVSDQITCGHDIETSWLLWETAEVINDENLKKEIKEVCIKLADAALKDGYDPEYGGICDDYKQDLKGYKIWWAQAEAVVGCFNAYQLTGDKKYYNYCVKFWETIKKYFIADNGEWYDAIKNDMSEIVKDAKITPYKCPYHNFRMCAEMMRRNKCSE